MPYSMYPVKPLFKSEGKRGQDIFRIWTGSKHDLPPLVAEKATKGYILARRKVNQRGRSGLLEIILSKNNSNSKSILVNVFNH